MRGIQHSGQVVVLGGGISPAHAGNTVERIDRSHQIPDQPRTCGEYAGAAGNLSPPGGSAPHMRGIPSNGSSAGRYARISPAHAGNTSESSIVASTVRDQPRTCGEYGGGIAQMVLPLGSAPHMRGIPFLLYITRDRPRISPAHAGNTLRARPPRDYRLDQPRTCGEYAQFSPIQFRR